MRNLGFEDTPDYDYLRELFTQALKNTGEVEDGEYDWMKLNNGKGWEAVKHSSQHLHAANAVPNSSARALGGGADTPRGPGTPGLNHLRPHAGQPLSSSPAKPGATKQRERPSAAAAGADRGGPLPKRQSGAAGGLNDLGTPAGSTQAQFQSSTANLGQQHRMSSNPSGGGAMGTGGGGGGAQTANAHSQGGQQVGTAVGGGGGMSRQANNHDPQAASGMQKFLRAICCSR